ncbi:hypothetical protein F4604DRAFT_1980159 [Suillus subluteus]|nr:hypothetical protein F4604DRAFT_1980159 [Suillus subluteus]
MPSGVVLYDELPHLPAVPEPTIPPSIVPSGAVLHDELPRLPVVPAPTIPPSIVLSGAVLHDELPCLPAVPEATPQPPTTTPQVLLPSLPNGIHLTSLTAKEPKGPCRTAHQHVPLKCEQALNVIGSSNARICTMAGVIEGKENDESNSMPMKHKAKPVNPQANKFSKNLGRAVALHMLATWHMQQWKLNFGSESEGRSPSTCQVHATNGFKRPSCTYKVNKMLTKRSQLRPEMELPTAAGGKIKVTFIPSVRWGWLCVHIPSIQKVAKDNKEKLSNEVYSYFGRGSEEAKCIT